MTVVVDTPLIHKSIAQVLNRITPNATIYDNPNQQATKLPAWFIIHREPVKIEREISRAWLIYSIDLFYMLEYNTPQLFDDYAYIADCLNTELIYLPIYGQEGFKTQVYEREWSLQLDALKYSFTLRFRVKQDTILSEKMQVIEDLSIFLKNQRESIVSFTNTEHPEFDPVYPNSFSVTTGKSVNLPYVGGRFEDDNYFWTPSSWDIGTFGELIKVDGNITANLEWEYAQKTATITFFNPDHPEFQVELPDPITDYIGNDVTLPTVDATFPVGPKDWKTSGWDIGDFGDDYQLLEDTEAHLLWTGEDVYFTVNFTNTEKPEFDVELPEQRSVARGNSIILPEVDGTFYEGSYEWTPEAWNLGDFGDEITIDDNTSIDLVWSSKLALPTVIIQQGFVLYTAADMTTYTEIQPGASTLLYSSGGQFPYPSGITFGVYGLNSAEQNLDKTKFEIYNDNGSTYLKNNSSSAVHIVAVYPAICESDEAEVVAVYDSQDNPFNAFKFNLDGTDYYYVLDLNQEDWTDDLSSIGYHLPAEYEEITLYLSEGNKYVQSGVTSATNKISTDNSYNNTVYQMYTDQSCTQPFTPDLSKVYTRQYGVYRIDQMPTTLSNTDSVYGRIILNSGMLWFVSNKTTAIEWWEDTSITVRVYPDNREWTTETLYDKLGQHSLQKECTCYTSPVPSGTSYVIQLYTDADRTTKFNYDLDREYRKVYDRDGSLVIAQIQSIWDMPTTTGSSASGFILLKTGQLWAIRNDNSTSIYQGSTSMIQSAPKQYDEPTITLDLGLRGDLSSVTFSPNDYWFSALRNPLDKQKAIDFGVDIAQSSGGGGDRISATIMNHFNVELVALCDAYENTVTTDMSNFFASTLNGALIIRSNDAYATATNYWRVRITKKTT